MVDSVTAWEKLNWENNWKENSVWIKMRNKPTLVLRTYKLQDEIETKALWGIATKYMKAPKTCIFLLKGGHFFGYFRLFHFHP